MSVGNDRTDSYSKKEMVRVIGDKSGGEKSYNECHSITHDTRCYNNSSRLGRQENVQYLSNGQNRSLMDYTAMPAEAIRDYSYQYEGYYSPHNTMFNEQMGIYTAKKFIDMKKDMAIQYQRKENQKELKQLENNNRIKRMEKQEELRLKRNLVTYGIYEDSDGFLCSEIINADGKKAGAKVLVKKRHLRMTCYWYEGKKWYDTVYEIRWDGNDDSVVLTENECTPNGIYSKLAKAGVAMSLGRNGKQELLDKLFSYLKSHMLNEEKPLQKGWNLMSDGQWFFADDNVWTIEEMKDYGKN